MDSFASRLRNAQRTKRTILCVGIDPHADLMPRCFGGRAQKFGTRKTLDNLRRFCTAVLESAQSIVPAVKFQSAFFEAHGPGGMAVLADMARDAQAQDMLVIMDAKRGDIGTTAKAYAQAWLGQEAMFPSDALTINPFLGLDSLEPFIEQAMNTKSGLFVLARTSNAGAADIQLKDMGGEPLFMRLARQLAPLIEAHCDEEITRSPFEKPTVSMLVGQSSIGMVVAPMGIVEARDLRKIVPSAPFLVPGYGIQGATAEQALNALYFDLYTKTYRGGLVNASRSLTFGTEVQAAKNSDDAIIAMRKAIEEAIEDLSQ